MPEELKRTTQVTCELNENNTPEESVMCLIKLVASRTHFTFV